jgi:hypothetical protein
MLAVPKFLLIDAVTPLDLAVLLRAPRLDVAEPNSPALDG